MNRQADSRHKLNFRTVWPIGCCVAAAALAMAVATIRVQAQSPGEVDADLLLRGGQILDGTGSPARPGDVAIAGDRIVAVGEIVPGKIGETIDCTGLILAPGFIDLHNHSDESIVADETRTAENYIRQGCTTLVTGNCGGGAVDVEKYLAAVDAHGAGTNVAHLIPHGSTRAIVLERRQVDPTPEEIAKMQDLVDRGMRAGAWGMATGLIYIPGAYAKIDELAAMTEVVGRHGGIYASHIRSEDSALLDAVSEAIEIGRRAKTPVHISHFKASGKPYWGMVRAAAKLVEDAQSAGQKVTADQYPYTASSTSLEAMLLPDWAREGGREATMARLADPVQLEKIRPALQTALDERPHVRIVSYKPKPEYTGKAIHEIAAAENRPQIDVAIELLRDGSPAAINFGMTEEDVRFVMQRPWVATASDGSVKAPSGDMVHPRSFGTFPRKIGLYAVREKVLPLEQAVRSATGLPADILGFSDRGYLRAGQFADVVAFSPQEIIDGATFDRPFEPPLGIPLVIVNGVPAVKNGVPTKSLSGRALRHASRLPP
ncbi:D-aminoacylase [Lacipirellula limnantheis]|uniref:D-aminoacylase n=2 Tax=Lacipirellula limnantheis TaxID=2528024 RepID=A0A517TT35_9BACT|nr:D-aminoacylase [Lacipirellula limnantheis]